MCRRSMQSLHCTGQLGRESVVRVTVPQMVTSLDTTDSARADEADAITPKIYPGWLVNRLNRKSLDMPHNLSLPLHLHTNTRMLFLLSLGHSLSPSISFSLSLAHSLTHTLSLSLSLSLSHLMICTYIYTYYALHTVSHILTQKRTHTQRIYMCIHIFINK